MVVRTFPTVVRTAERPIGNSVRPFGSPVPKPRSGPPDLDRTKQYEWPQSTTLLPSLFYMIWRLRVCVWRGVGGTLSGTTHDGGRVTTRPIGRIQATDLASQMDPAKAFDGAVQSAHALDFT